MSFQAAFNSALGSIESLMLLKTAKKAFDKTFGEKPTAPKSMREMLESKANYSTEERVQMAKDRVAQYQHQTSGQAGQDIEDMAAYEEQERAGTLPNKSEETAASAFDKYTEKATQLSNQKEALKQRKEYLRKPRVLNRHGVKYQEIINDKEGN